MTEKTESIIQNLLYQNYNKSFTDDQVSVFIDSMLFYEDISEDFIKYTNSFIKDLKHLSENNSDCVFLPCDIIELRQILSNNKYVGMSYISLFDFSFAKKYVTGHSCLIGLDKKILKNTILKEKGIYVFEKQLEVENLIKKIYCTERYDSFNYKTICKIVQEEKSFIPIYCLSVPPGVSPSKTAQKLYNKSLNKYVVNIGMLGIDNVKVKSESAEKAVQEVLNRQKKEDSIDFSDPKYSVEYWKKSGYWPMIVKKASKDQLNQIQFNDIEKQIFKFILDINVKYKLGITFRLAGGIVRDKLLGKESDDIDIAIDKMTGAQFGEYIKKEIGKSGNVIKSNPDQSKHLETMTINLFGRDIDFVNLRSEVYSDSRIPEMSMGTPEGDAERRDLTFNSLFYNINANSIEDFTGKGIQDLKDMVLRTPLDPVKTFTDDPLRVLRMLRFYSRYKGSTIDPAAIEAMKNPEVQKALKDKVSAERIYTEWNKLFVGSQQSKAIKLLYETGIWDNVLKPHEMKDFDPFTMDQKNKHHVDNVLEHTLKVIEEFDQILQADNAGDDERSKALAAAFLHDIGKLDPSVRGIKEHAEGIITNTYHGHEDISDKMAEIILKSLKASNEDIEYIRNIVKNHMLPHADLSDKQLRKLIRNFGKDLVKRIIQHAKADSLSKPGGNPQHYDSMLGRLQTIQPSTDNNRNKPPLNRQIIMSMPEFAQISSPNYIKLGWLNEITQELQDLKDENPNLTEEYLVNYCRQVSQKYIQKYLNMTPTPKTAQSWYEDMRNLGNKENRVDWIKGILTKQEDSYVISTSIGNYVLESNQNLSDLLNKEVHAKGLVDKNTIKSDYIVLAEDNQDKDVKFLDRNLKSDFIIGSKIRHRKRGIAFSQIEGIVEKVIDNKIYVKWDGIKELEIFNLNDPVSLYYNLSKI